jgi:general L-amino acid transport system permease protein
MAANLSPTLPDDGPPRHSVGIVGWLRRSLFSSPLNSLLTVLVGWLLLMAVPAMVEWLFVKANFSASTAAECRASGGACWAFIAEKHRLILFGVYPYDEQWRPLLASVVLIAVIICSCMRRFWKPWLGLLWVVALTVVAILMWGGVFGLQYVENDRWGGLPLTLILATFGIAFAFPFGLMLALGRRSHMPAVKALCVVYIELIRGVPLISLLFMSSVMLPLFLPEGFSIDSCCAPRSPSSCLRRPILPKRCAAACRPFPRGSMKAPTLWGCATGSRCARSFFPRRSRS